MIMNEMVCEAVYIASGDALASYSLIIWHFPIYIHVFYVNSSESMEVYPPPHALCIIYFHIPLHWFSYYYDNKQ